MNYMLNIIVCESHPFCLEMLPLYVGNLQVTKISCGREWTLSRVSLGALIRNGIGTCYCFFFSFLSIPYVLLYEDL